MSVTYCKNCGHESHCGVPLRKTLPGHSEIEQIEICKYCRCDTCISTPSAWGSPTVGLE